MEELEILRTLFSFFDKDKSGEIDQNELRAVLKSTLHNNKKRRATGKSFIVTG